MKVTTENPIKEHNSMFDVIPGIKHLAEIACTAPTTLDAISWLSQNGLESRLLDDDGEKIPCLGTADSFMTGYATTHYTASDEKRRKTIEKLAEACEWDSEDPHIIECITALDKIKADIEKVRRLVSPTGEPDAETDAFILGYIY